MPTKTWTVDLAHPDFAAWAAEHHLEPSLMGHSVEIFADGTVQFDQFLFKQLHDEKGPVVDKAGEPVMWFRLPLGTADGSTRAIKQPVRITPTRPIPEDVLTDPNPPRPTGTPIDARRRGRPRPITIDYASMIGDR